MREISWSLLDNEKQCADIKKQLESIIARKYDSSENPPEIANQAFENIAIQLKYIKTKLNSVSERPLQNDPTKQPKCRLRHRCYW